MKLAVVRTAKRSARARRAQSSRSCSSALPDNNCVNACAEAGSPRTDRRRTDGRTDGTDGTDGVGLAKRGYAKEELFTRRRLRTTDLATPIDRPLSA